MTLFTTAHGSNSIIYNIYMSLLYYTNDIQRVLKSKLCSYGNYYYITRETSIKKLHNWQLLGRQTKKNLGEKNYLEIFKLERTQ